MSGQPISGGREPDKIIKNAIKATSSYAICAWLPFQKRVPESLNNRHKGPHARSTRTKKGYMMRDFVDGTAFNNEQGNRARKLFAAVVLAALDDAIADDKKYGNGPEQIARWARSRDGREVLSCAGIDPNERVVSGLMDFVGKGVRTSVALSREESERRNAAEQEARAA
jgi:hypothetical protein